MHKGPIINKTALLILVDEFTPRITYTMNFVFRCVLGIDFKIIKHISDFNASHKCRLSYSTASQNEVSFSIIPQGLLYEKHIHKFNAQICYEGDIPYLSSDDDLKGIDPFSTIFFFLSRYEEYLPHKKDRHDRFLFGSGLDKENWRRIPVVDMWVDWIRLRLIQYYPDLQLKPKSYQFQPTYDIDHAKAYLWKGRKRNLLSLGRDIIQLDSKTIQQKWRVWQGREKDPFDVYEYWEEFHNTRGLSPVFFWLLGDYGPYDKNPSVDHAGFRQLIKKVSSKNEVGIHLSYRSHLNIKQIKKEITRLKEITGENVVKNRFHYLRFKLPESYRLLLDVGITNDYSMGFPNLIGFRAGTAHSFLWYDLEREVVTPLWLHPFQIMDVTLKNYMNLSTDKAFGASSEVINNIKKYGGTFTSLWHNSSYHLPVWDGWKEFYEKLSEEARKGY